MNSVQRLVGHSTFRRSVGSLAPQAQGLKLGNESEKLFRSLQGSCALSCKQAAVSCDPNPPEGGLGPYPSLSAKGKLFELLLFKCTSAFGPNIILRQLTEERSALSARFCCTPDSDGTEAHNENSSFIKNSGFRIGILAKESPQKTLAGCERTCREQVFDDHHNFCSEKSCTLGIPSKQPDHALRRVPGKSGV